LSKHVPAASIRITVYHLKIVLGPKHVVAVTTEEEEEKEVEDCCFGGIIVKLIT
jgi:hypothetical protein